MKFCPTQKGLSLSPQSGIPCCELQSKEWNLSTNFKYTTNICRRVSTHTIPIVCMIYGSRNDPKQDFNARESDQRSRKIYPSTQEIWRPLPRQDLKSRTLDISGPIVAKAYEELRLCVWCFLSRHHTCGACRSDLCLGCFCGSLEMEWNLWKWGSWCFLLVAVQYFKRDPRSMLF